MGKFESYPSISALADDDITLINHNTVTHKISFATLATLIKNRIGLQVDNVPTKDSINLATSGGIYSMIKDEEDRAISVENTKANQATTLSGYGITDAYTKTEADNKFSTFSGSYNDLINKPTIPTNTSQLINDSDFVVDSNYVHTDNNFTTTLKTKLNGIASGAEVNVQSDWNETDTTSDAYIANKPTIPSKVTVDSALSTSSKNPVQNKIITNALASKVDDTDLATVATSGSYNDLTDKPTIPTVNNATLTIQKNGTNVQTFTANASSNVTANITMSKSDVGLSKVGNFKAVSTVASQSLTDTEKANARANIGAGTSSFSGDYNDLSNKPALKTVATSGSYNDLTDKPTIPSGVTVDSDLSSTSENPVQNKVINTALSGKASSTHTHTLKIATSTGTSALTMAANTKYQLSAGGKTFIFTTPPNGGSTVTIGTTGTASATAVSYQRVGIDGTYTEINGTKYMTIDNTNATSYTFTNSAIKTNSVIDVYSSIWGDVVSSVTANNGSCVVTFSSATTRSVRIYIR